MSTKDSHSSFSEPASTRNRNTTSSSQGEYTDDTYVEENSLEEVEAVLDAVDDTITEALNLWNSPLPARRLSRITEATNEGSTRRSAAAPSLHTSDPIASSPVRPAGRRAGDLIAFFEDKTGDNRTGTSSPFSQSRSMPTIARPGYETASYTRSGTPSNPSPRPSSPSKASTFSTMISPSRYTAALPSITGESTYASSAGGAFSRSNSPTKSASMTTFLSPPRQPSPVSQYTRRPGNISASSALSSVRNIVAAWKERTPTLGKTSKGNAASTEGFFSIRRRAKERDQVSSFSPKYDELGAIAPPVPEKNGSGNGNGSSSPGKRSRTSSINPGFDLSDLGPYARGSQEPLRVGHLWYLNVHAPPVYRWQKCQAVLYPNMLLLSWIAPGGGRGIVTLDLINCTEVRSVPSPTHPEARDDIGTQAARLNDAGNDIGDGRRLVEFLCPFQLLYADGVERLGAESARERVRWVGAIWDALERATTFPSDRSSRSKSPAPSVRSARSIGSIPGSSVSGSSSTMFVPPMDTIPDLPTTLSHRSSVASSIRHAVSDDGAISNSGLLYVPGQTGGRVIAPSRSSSIRRTTSLNDIDAEYVTASSRASATHQVKSISSQSSSSASYHSALTGSSIPRSSVSTVPFEATHAKYATAASTAIDAISPRTGTRIVPSTLSLRGVDDYSLLGDSHEGSITSSTQRSPFSTPTRRTVVSSTKSPSSPSRPGSGRRRTHGRPRTVSNTQLEDGSDKENTYTSSIAGKSQHTTPTKSAFLTRTGPSTTGFDTRLSSDLSGITTPSYSYSLSYTASETGSELSRSEKEAPLPSEAKSSYVSAQAPTSTSASEFQTADQPSTVYHTAAIPSKATSFRTVSSVASSTYETCSTCGSATSFNSARTCTCSNYQTASVCPSTEYVTAEAASSQPSLAPATPDASLTSDSFSVFPPLPSSKSTTLRTASLFEDSLTPHERVTSPVRLPSQPASLYAPSTTPPPSSPPTIPSEGSQTPRYISLATLSPDEQHDLTLTPTPSVDRTPSVMTPSSVSTAGLPSSSWQTLSIPTIPVSSSILSSVSSTTVSSVPTDPRLSSSPSRSSESLYYVSETDVSFNSTILNGTPSTQSVAVPEGPDISFDTSFLRPSRSYSTSDIRSQLPSISILSRSPSSVSTASGTSISSSKLDSRSLYDFSTRTATPSNIPLPSSPTAPDVSISVSVSTPQGNIPSIASVLQTESSESSASLPSPSVQAHEPTPTPSPPPPISLIPDLEPVFHLLRELEGNRTKDNDGVHEHLDRLERDLRHLGDLFPSFEQHREAAPPVPHKDRSVGPSIPGMIVQSITPPLRLPSPSSLYSSISFLSSHHSDDQTLAKSESTSLTSSVIDDSDDSHSSTPSVSSSMTARPAPAIGVVHLRDMIENIRAQIFSLNEGQRETNERLDRLGRDAPAVLDERPYTDNLLQIQNLLNAIMDRLAPIEDVAYSSTEPSISSITESELRKRWAMSHIEDIVHPIPRPPRRSPPPADSFPLPTPSLPHPPAVVAPPPFTPFITVPPRLLSPPIASPPPRVPRTAPIEIPQLPRVSPFPSRFGDVPRRPGRVLLPQQGVTIPEHSIVQPGPGRPPPTDIGPNFQELLQRLRQEQGRGDPDGVFVPPPRPVLGDLHQEAPGRSTAPPDLGDIRDVRTPRSWYPRPAGHRPAVQTADMPPEDTRTESQASVRPPATFTPDRVPRLFNDLLEHLRENRHAQNASLGQQREMMRYMRALNDWLARDVDDRQREIRSLGARIDQLRNELASRLDIAPTGPILPPPPIIGSGPIPGSSRFRASSPPRSSSSFSERQSPVLPAVLPHGSGFPPQFGPPMPTPFPLYGPQMSMPSEGFIPPPFPQTYPPGIGPQGQFIPPPPLGFGPSGPPQVTVIQPRTSPQTTESSSSRSSSPSSDRTHVPAVVPDHAPSATVQPPQAPVTINIGPQTSHTLGTPPPIHAQDIHHSPSRASEHSRSPHRPSRTRTPTSQHDRPRSPTPDHPRSESRLHRHTPSPTRRGRDADQPQVIHIHTDSRRSPTPPPGQVFVQPAAVPLPHSTVHSERSSPRHDPYQIHPQTVIQPPTIIQPPTTFQAPPMAPPPFFQPPFQTQPQTVIVPPPPRSSSSSSRHSSRSRYRPTFVPTQVPLPSSHASRRSRSSERRPIVIPTPSHRSDSRDHEGRRHLHRDGSSSRRHHHRDPSRSRSSSRRRRLHPRHSRADSRSSRRSDHSPDQRSRRDVPPTVHIVADAGRPSSRHSGRRSATPERTIVVTPSGSEHFSRGSQPPSRYSPEHREQFSRRATPSPPRAVIVETPDGERHETHRPASSIHPVQRSASPAASGYLHPSQSLASLHPSVQHPEEEYPVEPRSYHREPSPPSNRIARTPEVEELQDDRREPSVVVPSRPASRYTQAPSRRGVTPISHDDQEEPSAVIPSRPASRYTQAPSRRGVTPISHDDQREPSVFVPSRPASPYPQVPSHRGVTPISRREDRTTPLGESDQYEEPFRGTPRVRPEALRETPSRSRRETPPIVSDADARRAPMQHPSPSPELVHPTPQRPTPTDIGGREGSYADRSILPSVITVSSRGSQYGPDEPTRRDARGGRAEPIIRRPSPEVIEVPPPHDMADYATPPGPTRQVTPRSGVSPFERAASQGSFIPTRTEMTPRELPTTPATALREVPASQAAHPVEQEAPASVTGTGLSEPVTRSVTPLETHGDPRGSGELREQRYLDSEAQRNAAAQEAEARRQAAFEEAEQARQRAFQALAAQPDIQPPLEGEETGEPTPPKPESEYEPSIAASEHVRAIQQEAERLADRRIAEILQAVKEEREANERDLLAAAEERRHLDDIANAERTRIAAEHEGKITALEEELRSAREALETERQERIAAETARIERDTALAETRHDAITGHLDDITNIVTESREQCAQKLELCNQRYEENQSRREEKEAKQQQLVDLVNSIIAEREQERARAEEEKSAAAQKPGIEAVLEAMQRQQAEQTELLNSIAEGWRTDSAKQHESTLEAVRQTAQEQVPFNVEKYLDDFSKALAQEVRILLSEVGKLREEKRGLQYEIGFLLCARSKYGPGGEFDQEWKPTTGPLAPQPPPPLPEDPPEEIIPASGAWRSIRGRTSAKRTRKAKENVVPAPVPEPRPPVASWATWQPNLQNAPSPPPADMLPVPERPPSGLFGPRSPRDWHG